jgi:hypothetical protein
MSVTEIQMVPGTPTEWREFKSEDYDPLAEPGSDDDALGVLLADRTGEDMFGVTVVVGPVEIVPDNLIKRLAAGMIPTKIQRQSEEEHKAGEKKNKKQKDK